MTKTNADRNHGRLSQLDADIISLLQIDARRPNTDIANQLGVAEGTVRNRIGKMIGDGILKFEVWADPLKIGYQTYAFIDIQVNPPDLEHVAEELAEFPEIVFVGVCTGSFDIHIAALFSSNEHMYEMLSKRLNNVRGVLRTSSSSVLRIVKREFQYPVPGTSLDEAVHRSAMEASYGARTDASARGDGRKSASARPRRQTRLTRPWVGKRQRRGGLESVSGSSA